MTLDRHKLIQILGNLLSNARHALKKLVEGRRASTCECWHGSPASSSSRSRIPASASVRTCCRRLFEFGFTTKKDGHGFGLHTSAILAKELGGELVAHSDGPNRGARFTLRLLSNANASDARTVAGIAR